MRVPVDMIVVTLVSGDLFAVEKIFLKQDLLGKIFLLLTIWQAGQGNYHTLLHICIPDSLGVFTPGRVVLNSLCIRNSRYIPRSPVSEMSQNLVLRSM